MHKAVVYLLKYKILCNAAENEHCIIELRFSQKNCIFCVTKGSDTKMFISKR